MFSKILFIACVASATELQFKDSSGTCSIDKSGTSLAHSCGITTSSAVVDGMNIVTELGLSATRISNLETRVTNNENGIATNRVTLDSSGSAVCPSGMSATSDFTCMSTSQYTNNMHEAEHYCITQRMGQVCSYNDYTVACGAHYHGQISFDPMLNMNPGWLGDKTHMDNYFVVSNTHGCTYRNYRDWDASYAAVSDSKNYRCCL